MRISAEWEGLTWPIYKSYYLNKRGSKNFIIADIDKGLLNSYNPVINIRRNKPVKSNKLFTKFAPKEITEEKIINLSNKYGLPWDINFLERKYGVPGAPIELISKELSTLSTALRVFKACQKNQIDELKKYVTITAQREYYRKHIKKMTEKDLKKIKEIRTDNTDFISKEKYLIGDKNKINISILKNESFLEFDLEDKIFDREELREILRASVLFWLSELITDNIRDNEGLNLYYSRIHKDDDSFPEYSILPVFRSSNLIGVLWVQFFNVFTTNQKVDICKNDTCDELFLKYGRREYCSDKCRNLHNIRILRKKKKNN